MLRTTTRIRSPKPHLYHERYALYLYLWICTFIFFLIHLTFPNSIKPRKWHFELGQHRSTTPRRGVCSISPWQLRDVCSDTIISLLPFSPPPPSSYRILTLPSTVRSRRWIMRRPYCPRPKLICQEKTEFTIVAKESTARPCPRTQARRAQKANKRRRLHHKLPEQERNALEAAEVELLAFVKKYEGFSKRMKNVWVKGDTRNEVRNALRVLNEGYFGPQSEASSSQATASPTQDITGTNPTNGHATSSQSSILPCGSTHGAMSRVPVTPQNTREPAGYSTFRTICHQLGADESSGLGRRADL